MTEDNNNIPVSPNIPVEPTQPDAGQQENTQEVTITTPVQSVSIEHQDIQKPTLRQRAEEFFREHKLLVIAGLVFIGLLLFLLLFLLVRKLLFPPKPKLVTLTYWGLWDSKEIMDPLIQEYQQLHPNIKINYIQQDFAHRSEDYAYIGNYYAAVTERLSQTGGVDIMRVHHSWLPNIARFLTAAPAGLFDIQDIQNNYYKPALQAMLWGENVVSVPLQIDSVVMFYNPTLLEQAQVQTPPKDWEQVLQYAPKLTQKDGDRITTAGIAIGTGSNVFHAPEILLMLFTQSDVPILDPQTRRFALTTEEAAAALKYYVNFHEQGVWSYKLPMDLSMFVNCRLAILFAPSWRAINFRASNPELDFAVAPPPVLPGARPDVDQYIANFYVEVVPKNSPNAKEAWEFLKWLSEPEQLQKLYANQRSVRGLDWPSPRKDVGESQDSYNPLAAIVHQMAPKTRTWFIYDWGLWEQVIRKLLITLESDPQAGKRITPSTLAPVEEELNNKIFLTNTNQ